MPAGFVDLCRQAEVGFVSGKLWKAKPVLVSLDPVSGAAASREEGQNWHRGWMPLAHPALPVCFVSSHGFCCAVSGLAGEESDCEERRAGRAGKGNEVLSFNAQNLLQWNDTDNCSLEGQ